jgi:hypothetical protein
MKASWRYWAKIADFSSAFSEVAADAFGQYNLTTGIINERVKAVYDTIGRIKGTRLKHDEIAE